MCGIIAICSQEYHNVLPDIKLGLKKMEYRGYDSCGIGYIRNNRLEVFRSTDSSNLDELIKDSDNSSVSIGHNRWATHGESTIDNTHPLFTDKIAIAHNGTIENFASIKEKLSNTYNFKSKTDSEVILALVEKEVINGKSLEDSFKDMLKSINGSYAIVLISSINSRGVFFAKKNSPLVIGVGENLIAAASDESALPEKIDKVFYLEDESFGFFSSSDLKIFNKDQIRIEPSFEKRSLTASPGQVNSSYDTHMLREINEQPDSIQRIIDAYTNKASLNLNISDRISLNPSSVHIIACGSSYHSGLCAINYFESYSKIPCFAHVASEFIFKDIDIYDKNSLFIFISQSGETMDTVHAIKKTKAAGFKSIGVTNSSGSTISRLVDAEINCLAGKEVSVASTKAFTAQLLILALISLSIGQRNKKITNEAVEKLILDLNQLSRKINEVIGYMQSDWSVCEEIINNKIMVYIGKGQLYPISLEGALKMKEISYLPSECVPAGELKHGFIALIDNLSISIASIDSQSSDFEKAISSISEISARKGNIIVISDKNGVEKIKSMQETIKVKHFVQLPESSELGKAIISTIPLQILAYQVATRLGKNVDKPRNLAKSVTVD